MSFDWSLSLTVGPQTRVIPLPATLPLLLGALGLATGAAAVRFIAWLASSVAGPGLSTEIS